MIRLRDSLDRDAPKDTLFMESLATWMRDRRLAMISFFDILAWGIAAALAAACRMDLDLQRVGWFGVAELWVLVCVLSIGLGRFVGLHRGRAPLASLQEMWALGMVTAVTGILAFVANLLVHAHPVPRSVPLLTMFLAMVLMGFTRAAWQRAAEAGLITKGRENSLQVLVVGAGVAGRQLIRSMLTEAGSTWRPVALLDDDVHKRHLRLSGVPVCGTTYDIARLASETGATALVVAIPGLDGTRLGEITGDALDAGLTVKVLPGVFSLLGAKVDIRDVRDLDLEDLLGRRTIQTDVDSIAGYLTGKRVMVTGAGGSIGSELCRQVSQWHPAELIMLDRDESALHATQLSIHGRALLDSDEVVLADIRDAGTVFEIFRRRRPQVVFHAAALKHLPMLEQYPGEAVQTNVWGTMSILDACLASGVERFVNISTDKAADPISVLGYSKRIAEQVTSHAAMDAEGEYMSVRFGNVLGSRGSVLVSFTAQIAAGGPVTVTHPDVTRYFMTVAEAVQLVIQAGAIGRNGEALVFDMGQPVSIDSVARRLIQLSGTAVEIEYTGLRQGEKLIEVLTTADEPDYRPVHPLISHVSVPTLDPSQARALDPGMAPSQIIKALDQLCPRVPSHAVEAFAHELRTSPR
jgi:FlaA1/EpsC-like NDP-sugar epimerase